MNDIEEKLNCSCFLPAFLVKPKLFSFLNLLSILREISSLWLLSIKVVVVDETTLAAGASFELHVDLDSGRETTTHASDRMSNSFSMLMLLWEEMLLIFWKFWVVWTCHSADVLLPRKKKKKKKKSVAVFYEKFSWFFRLIYFLFKFVFFWEVFERI